VSSDRDSFLQRVRRAVAEGNRAGAVPPLPERGTVGYQGAGPDPLARLRDEVAAAGGTAHLVADLDAAVATVLALVQQRSAHRVLLGDGALLHEVGLEAKLAALGIEARTTASLGAGSREAFFVADVGITGADALVAETGTVALETRPGQPRALSLLPPVHVVVATREQVVGDLFDLFQRPGALPSCLSLITGPSKTGDIELKLVTGVHGPGEVHVVVVTA
jgi:L-lactate utilization protein LutC